jgi:hypothetical protein
MRRSGEAVVRAGWRGLFALVGGVASLAGVGVVSCGMYGPAPMYGPVSECTTSTDCETKHAQGWYCDNRVCLPPGDAGK